MKKVIIVNPINYNRGSYRPPFGLLTIASKFIENGVSVVWIDADVLKHEGLIFGKIRNNLDADLIAIGGMHTSYRYIKEFFGELDRLNINIPTIIGGRIALSLEHVLIKKIPNLDMICTQEGEYVIDSICNNNDIRKSLGIKFMKNNELYTNPPAKIKKSLDEVPMLPWHLLDKQTYLAGKYFYMYSSIGCPFQCSFCRVLDNKRDIVKYKTIDLFVSEIKNIMLTYNTKNFIFVDEFFLTNKKRIWEFCEKIKSLNIKWSCSSRVDSISTKDIKLLKMMKSAGCQRINLGLESASPTILNLMHKKQTIEKMEIAVNTIRNAKLSLKSTFIYGHPGESPETAIATANWCKKMNITGSPFFLVPYPGSEIYNQFKKDHFHNINEEEAYILRGISIKGKGGIINLTEMADEEFFNVHNKVMQIIHS